jgi:hypothetical protein
MSETSGDPGASNADMAKPEQAAASDPFVGDVIPGLAGLRKGRFAMSGRGKRGGGRAVYYLIVREDVAIMIFADSKSDQEDLTAAQRKAARALIEELNHDKED